MAGIRRGMQRFYIINVYYSSVQTYIAMEMTFRRFLRVPSDTSIDRVDSTYSFRDFSSRYSQHFNPFLEVFWDMNHVVLLVLAEARRRFRRQLVKIAG